MKKIINTLKAIYQAHKYKIGIFFLLMFASIICVSLVFLRTSFSGSHRYGWLIWNLFLAWIPFILAAAVYILSWRKWFIYVIIPIFIFLWLIFFPNAPYILTDLQHLNLQRTANVPLWYDVILLVWFSWTGMLLGIVSLNLVQEVVGHRFGKKLGWIFVLAVAGLSSIGVYIGRFIRLNSWDILQDPTGITRDLWTWIQEPSLRSVGFIGLYTLFFLFAYLTIYAFGHVLQEKRGKDS